MMDNRQFDLDHPPLKVVAVQVNGSEQQQHRIEIRTLQIFQAYTSMHGDDTIISLDGVPNVKKADDVFSEFVKHLGLDPRNLLSDDEYESDSEDVGKSVEEFINE